MHPRLLFSAMPDLTPFTIVSLDSGIGGLQFIAPFLQTISSSLSSSSVSSSSSFRNTASQKLQNIILHYCADSEAFPYASLSAKNLQSRLQTLLEFSAPHADLIILACNSLATITHHNPQLYLRPPARNMPPIFAITPALQQGLAQSSSKHILLIASTHTSTSPWVDGELHQASHHQPALTCLRMGSLALVRASEMHFFQTHAPQHSPLKTQNTHSMHRHLDACHRTLRSILRTHPLIDSIVLACTHFTQTAPWLRNILDHDGCKHIRITDSSQVHIPTCTQTLQAAAKNTRHPTSFPPQAHQHPPKGLECHIHVHCDYSPIHCQSIANYLQTFQLSADFHSFRHTLKQGLPTSLYP